MALNLLGELWPRLKTLHHAVTHMALNEGLRPLEFFHSFEEMLSVAGDVVLDRLVDVQLRIQQKMQSVQPYLHPDTGTCKSINGGEVQPLIATIYGPTGCGKSQLLRNLISAQLIKPPPETVFFIVPDVDMISPGELNAWRTQICEGNYYRGEQGTLVPRSGTLLPDFKIMAYADLCQEHNYDPNHPQNVFANAAKKGPICIIMDECMEDLGGYKGIAKFFHAFPSKLHDRFPKCTGYSLFVVLHNMNPRRDHAGNIANLKIQSKLHIISPKMQPAQLHRFVNIYTKGLATAVALLLKDIFAYHASHSQYDWIIYHTCPENEALQWMYLHPRHGLVPMYLNIQETLYETLSYLSHVLKTRDRWRRSYRSKRGRREDPDNHGGPSGAAAQPPIIPHDPALPALPPIPALQ